MDSLLAKTATGKALDLVMISNAASVTSGASEMVTIDHEVSNENLGKSGVVISALIKLSASGGMAAVEALNGSAIVPVVGNTATRVSLGAVSLGVTDAGAAFQTLRCYRAEGATLAASTPLSGSTLPASGKFGAKGFEDVEIKTGTSITGDESTSNVCIDLKAGTTLDADSISSCQILPAVKLTEPGSGTVGAGELKAIALIERAR